jgi:hypothetical protein
MPTDAQNTELLKGMTFLDSSIAKIIEVTKDEVGSCLWPERGGYSYFGTVKVTSYVAHVPKELRVKVVQSKDRKTGSRRGSGGSGDSSADTKRAKSQFLTYPVLHMCCKGLVLDTSEHGGSTSIVSPWLVQVFDGEKMKIETVVSYSKVDQSMERGAERSHQIRLPGSRYMSELTKMREPHGFGIDYESASPNYVAPFRMATSSVKVKAPPPPPNP